MLETAARFVRAREASLPPLQTAILPVNWRDPIRDKLRAIRSSPEAAERSRPVRDQIDRLLDGEFQVSQLVACAQLLANDQSLESARELYRTLGVVDPTSPAGPLGLARLAMRERSWAEALAAWGAVIARGGEEPKGDWLAGKARALVGVGRSADALAYWDQAIGSAPGSAKARWVAAKASTLMKLGRWQDALECWQRAIPGADAEHKPSWVADRAHTLDRLGRSLEALTSLESCEQDQWAARLVRISFQCLIKLRRIPDARESFVRHLRRCDDANLLSTLINDACRLFDDPQRSQILQTILDKASAIASGPDPAQVPIARESRLRALLALRRYEAYLDAFDAEDRPPQPDVHAVELAGVAKAIRHRGVPNYGRPKLFGIGLSRTGTSSLAAALKVLGYRALHWANPLTGALIGEDDMFLFDAFVDTPCCVGFEENYHRFPNSKFIYTVRPIHDWERSWTAFVQRNYNVVGFEQMAALINHDGQFPHGHRFREIFQTLYYSYENYREAFRAYDLRVRTFFADKPSERFLTFDVFAGDGWEELCTFLDCGRPSTPYPWENYEPTRRQANP